MPVVGNQQILPCAGAVGIVVGGGSVGGRQNIARCIVGVGISFGAAGLLGQLVLGIVGIGVGGAVFRVGGNIAQNIVGVAVGDIRGKIIGQSRYLGCGVGAGNVPVGVGFSVDAACDGGEPLQFVVAVCQRIAHSGLVGSQQTGGFTVGIGFGIVGVSNTPVLSGELSPQGD